MPEVYDPTQKIVGQHQLEYRILYAVIVAGKNAKFADSAMTKLQLILSLRYGQRCKSYFAAIRRTGDKLPDILKEAGTGNYTKIAKCFSELVRAKIDLRTCTPQQLEKIHGIGPKSSRFFILWTRPHERYAALDVHILKWLHERGHYGIPKNTPTGGEYLRIESLFIAEADKRGLTPRELDWKIWQESSGYNGTIQSE